VDRKNIVLVGFMGTGKTTVAKALARKLRMHYVSTDALIEKREGMTIADIFSQKGEGHFRDIEAKVAAEAAGSSGAVIDTGGGIVMRNENIAALRKNGIVVCLEAGPADILERTARAAHRPLLNVEDPKKAVEELLKARAAHYGKADHRVDTSALSVDEVVKKIVEIVRN